MSEREEELDLDSSDAAKALLGETKKKKPKAKAKVKAKTRKPKESSGSSEQALPLSMLEASPDDLVLYEAMQAASRSQKTAEKPYKTSARFSKGDVIKHKSFGTGFVLAETGLNKIEVLFSAGRKLLVTAPKA